MPTQARLKAEVVQRLRAGHGFALATLNLDHLAKMAAAPAFAQIYAQQDFVVADGRPVVALSRLAGTPVELMPGSDLVVPLCRLAQSEGVSVALLGSTDIVLQAAGEALTKQIPGLNIELRYAPPLEFDPDGPDARAVLAQLNAGDVRLCFLALGAPKQERLAVLGRSIAPQVGFISVGAALDFLGGGQKRAPVWMRRTGVEWLWRTIQDPRRMAPRYARCLCILPGHFLQALRQRLGR